MWQVYASEFASLIGRHPYRSRHETILTILARAKVVKYKSTETQINEATKQLYAGANKPKVIISDKDVAVDIQRAVASGKLDSTAANLLQKHAHQVARKTNGQVIEEQIVKQDKIRDNNKKAYTLALIPNKVIVIGRIDGQQQDGKYIEIKMRNKPIDLTIAPPDYDIIQCRLYMAMLQSPSILLREECPAPGVPRLTVLTSDEKTLEVMKCVAIDTLDQMMQLVSNQSNLSKYQQAVAQKQWSVCDALLLGSVSNP